MPFRRIASGITAVRWWAHRLGFRVQRPETGICEIAMSVDRVDVFLSVKLRKNLTERSDEILRVTRMTASQPLCASTAYKAVAPLSWAKNFAESRTDRPKARAALVRASCDSAAIATRKSAFFNKSRPIEAIPLIVRPSPQVLEKRNSFDCAIASDARDSAEQRVACDLARHMAAVEL